LRLSWLNFFWAKFEPVSLIWRNSLKRKGIEAANFLFEASIIQRGFLWQIRFLQRGAGLTGRVITPAWAKTTAARAAAHNLNGNAVVHNFNRRDDKFGGWRGQFWRKCAYGLAVVQGDKVFSIFFEGGHPDYRKGL